MQQKTKHGWIAVTGDDELPFILALVAADFYDLSEVHGLPRIDLPAMISRFSRYALAELPSLPRAELSEWWQALLSAPGLPMPPPGVTPYVDALNAAGISTWSISWQESWRRWSRTRGEADYGVYAAIMSEWESARARNSPDFRLSVHVLPLKTELVWTFENHVFVSENAWRDASKFPAQLRAILFSAADQAVRATEA
ncbi:hypothetical protein [Mycetocola saprophilus]|uniref:hypothetical protein n=1 Tax=Mycetocola saprophilus TaxID=76636 RepID=UPI0004BE5968|nr:hypothetical protein [Mycetocola saprophilus]